MGSIKLQFFFLSTILCDYWKRSYIMILWIMESNISIHFPLPLWGSYTMELVPAHTIMHENAPPPVSLLFEFWTSNFIPWNHTRPIVQANA